jgi:hypothetical protein
MGHLGPLKDADISLVRVVTIPGIGKTLYCVLHGAMNKLTKDGIWRCVSAYRVEWGPDAPPQGRIIENICKAGCVATRGD